MSTKYLAMDDDLVAVRTAIRNKAGTSGTLVFPSGFISEVNGLNVGVGLTNPAGAGDIRSGKKAVVNRSTVTGTMSEKAAATYDVSGSNQTIAANQFLTGAQTIRGVTTENIAAANIKYGVNIKVGDTASAGRIKNVTGTYATDVNELLWVRAIESKSIQYVNNSNYFRFKTDIRPGAKIRAYIIYDEDGGGPVPYAGIEPYMKDYYIQHGHTQYDLEIDMRFPYHGDTYSVRPWLGYKVVG